MGVLLRFLAALLVTASLSGCLLRAGGPDDESQWVEIFEFEIQPPDLDEQAALDRVNMFGGEKIISARHVGWVEGPGGRIDFINHTEIDSSLGPLPSFCQSIVWPNGGSSGCGGPGDVEGQDQAEPIQIGGGGGSDLWQEAEFTVSDDVVEVIGTTAGGVTYTVVPRAGLGFVQWPTRRGDLDLVAYDAAGNELGRARTEPMN